MRSRSRIFSLALATLAACASPGSATTPSASAGQETPAKDDESFTRCDDDGDCLLSCIEVDDCCTKSCGCDKARHGKDNEAIIAKRRDCSSFDWSSCKQEDCAQENEVAYVPKCKRHRCVAEKLERKPPPAPIDTRKYDRTCKVDADCTLVNPQPCDKCGCASTPIASREQSRFADAMAKVECPPYDPWPNIQCGSCVSPEVFCNAGQCATR